jgi:hypothetical protein
MARIVSMFMLAASSALTCAMFDGVANTLERTNLSLQGEAPAGELVQLRLVVLLLTQRVQGNYPVIGQSPAVS